MTPAMPLDTEILMSAFCFVAPLRVLLFGEIKRYKSPIRIRIPKGTTEEVVVAAEVMAVEATHPALISINLFNDTQTNVLASSHLGQKQITVSETLLDYYYLHIPPEGEKTLSAPALMKREMTPSLKSLQEREKTPCAQFLQEREKIPCINTDLPVGGRLRHFLIQWEEQGAHWSILSLLRDGYKLISENAQICPECPASPAVTQALTKCLVDLYSRPAAQRHYQGGAYPKLLGILQSAVPGPKTRQSLEASHRLKFIKQISGHTKILDIDPGINLGLPQERRVGYLYRSLGRLPACTYPYPVSKIPQIPP